MKIADSYTFDADQETVWKLLMDPNAIAKALPGVDQLVPIEGEALAWRASAKVGVAQVSGTYAGTVRMTELDEPNQFRLTVSGEGQQSIIGGTALLKLTYDAAKKKTVVSWDADANVSGRLASVGQRLVSAAAAMMSKQFFRGLASQLPKQQADEPES